MLKRQIRRFGEYLFRAIAGQTLTTIPTKSQREILAAVYLQQYMSPYFPWTTGALRPSGIITAINDIVINEHRMVLECGSGVSTMVLGRACRAEGAKLVSLEEDLRWAEFCKKRIAQEGMEDTVKIVCAPRKVELGRDWYDTSVVMDALDDYPPVSLLVVDGPGVGEVRRHAVPVLRHRLDEDFTILLDDIPRGGREFMREWEEILSVEFRLLLDFAVASSRSTMKLFHMPA